MFQDSFLKIFEFSNRCTHLNLQILVPPEAEFGDLDVWTVNLQILVPFSGVRVFANPSGYSIWKIHPDLDTIATTLTPFRWDLTGHSICPNVFFTLGQQPVGGSVDGGD